MLAETKCGFNKWSIGVNENYDVKVVFGYYPGYMDFTLSDISVEEMRKLGTMFQFMADKYNAKLNDTRPERIERS